MNEKLNLKNFERRQILLKLKVYFRILMKTSQVKQQINHNQARSF